MAAADACPGFPTNISATFNVPTSFKILTCSRLLWGPRSSRGKDDSNEGKDKAKETNEDKDEESEEVESQ